MYILFIILSLKNDFYVKGARVIGCCAHIASVLWYLSFGRHLPQIHLPAQKIDSEVIDASQYDYIEESDELGDSD
jgi:hypothetical protein